MPAAPEPAASAPPPPPAAYVPPPREAPSTSSPAGTEDASVGDLVKELSEQSSTLARQEMRLAQLEVQEKAKRAGVAVGVFAAAGIAAFFGVAALLVAAVAVLDTTLVTWFSAAIVGVVLLVIAGVAALAGKKQIEQATPPVPEQAIGSVKRDVETVKSSAKH